MGAERGLTDYTGQNATLVGWGCATTTCSNPEEAFAGAVLREALMEVISNDEAACWFMRNDGKDEYIPEGIFITGGDESGAVSTCKGDSGSPVLLGDTLIGLVSWSKGCGRPFRPSVWTRVESFVPWIKNVVRMLPNRVAF